MCLNLKTRQFDTILSTGANELSLISPGLDVNANNSTDTTGGTAIYSEFESTTNRDSSGSVALIAPISVSSVAATSDLPYPSTSTLVALSKEMPPAVLLPLTLEKTIYLRKKISYLGT